MVKKKAHKVGDSWDTYITVDGKRVKARATKIAKGKYRYKQKSSKKK